MLVLGIVYCLQSGLTGGDPADQLVDLARAVHVMRGHWNPIAAADAVLLTWPFEVTE